MSSRGRGRGRGRGGARGGRGGARGGARSTFNNNNAEAISHTNFPQNVPVWINPEFEELTPNQLRSIKLRLLNTVSASLIKEPRFSDGDSVTNVIKGLVKQVSFYDPEFILKVALYTRDDLGIRSAATYVVALGANLKQCQPYLRKYFNSIVRLPSDWLDIAATFHVLPDKYLEHGSLPTALRKAMVDKFPDFDVYQLGKYNKERSIKRKQKKVKKINKEKGIEEPQKKEDKPMLTIKQMIRQLHIAKPQYNTMCILGKKYPINEDEFARLDLPGSFEPARAGKRMKLPTPETWETLLSEKGNKASTWEELIEHNKLPFMAMLRNLRNLILTGVHPKYHKWVMNKLTNERSVASSRQFPTRFFSAYEVIPKDIEDFKAKLAAQNATPAAKPAAKKGAKDQKKRKPKKVITPAYMPSANLFNDYRQALDTAVKIATVHNIKPIYGSTAVLCHSSRDMEADCASARGLGAIKKLNEVGALLGLMCKYACEEAEFIIFSSPSSAIKEGFSKLELIEGTILDNMKVVLNKAAELGGGSEFPFDHVEELIRQRRKIDNLVVISSKLIAPGQDEMASSKTDNTVSKILKKYRQEVNPNLLFFSIDLSGRPAIFSDEEKHPNDILISGFSDSILRFIAERGDSNQLHYVENLDIAKKLIKSKEHKTPAHLEQLDKLALAEEARKQNADLIDPGHTHTPGEWRTAKVFISSTFVDMHSERDVLTRYVFPELEERCKKRNIHLVYVDLRWGVTEEETQQNRSVQICLEEIDRCRPFFLGMISERYGWTPNDYAVDDVPQFDWVKEYPKKRSITELEIQHGYLRDTNSHGVFFLRDSSFLESVPDEHKKNFASENDEARQKIADLKQLVRQNARNGNVFDYKTIWAGFKEGKALLKGLEKFRKTAVDALWSAICKEFAEENVDIPVELDDITKERNYHLNFIHSRSRKFIGRKEIMDQLTKHVNGTQHSTIAVVGKAGSGKSALVATFAREYAKQHPNVFVLPHFIGASPRSTDIRHTLRRLCTELCHRFHINEEIPDDYKELCQTFVSVIEQASFKGRILLIIDALDQLSKADRAHNLDWLPSSDSLPIKLIVSTLEGPCLDNLRRKKWNVPEVMVAALSLKERREIVVETLADYRKKLDEKPMNDQMRVLLKKSDSDKPLYLVLACQELRMFGVYEELTERIRTLSPTLPKLLEEILLRFEADHSKDLMKTVTCLIACSRGGLMEEEMMQLLRRKHKNEASLPRAMWARIFSTIQLFLRPLDDTGNGSLEFYHREMTRIIRKRYLEYDHEAETSIHKMLAEHFYSKADPKGDGSFAGTDARAFSELPHHLIKAKAWKLAEKTLCSLTFIERKCALGMTFDLVCDYLEACEDGLPWKGHDRERENVDSFRHFVVGNSHILAEASHLTYQQAANQPDFTAPARIAKALGSNNKLWLKWRNKPTTHDAVQMTIKEAEAITAVAVSSYDNKIAVALKSSTVKVFNGKTGMEIASMTGHSNWITCIAFAPGGDAVTTASWDETLKIFDIGSSSELATLNGHTRLVSSVTYSPDGKQLLSGSWDCSVRLWNSYEGTPGWIFRGHTKPVNCVAFSPDGRRIVACAWDGSLRIWDSEEHNTLIVMGGNAASLRSCRFSPNAKQIVSTGVDGNIKIWDSFAGKEITTLRGHSKAVTSCAYSSDGQQLVTGSEDHTLRVWDAILGKEITGTNWKEGWLNNVAYSSDGQYIAGGSSECFIVLYNASDLTEAGRFIGHTRAVTAVAFSPDNKLLASGADDSQIFIWDVASMQIVHRLSGHRDVICNLQFSPDGSELLTCSDDFTTRAWDVHTGETIAVLGEHTGPVKACTYSPNGKFIATAGRDSVVLLWNANTKNLLNRFTGHLDWVNALDFSPDSKRLVSASWDFNGKVWDVAKAKELSTLSGHTSALGCAKFTPDGKCIITGSFDGTLKVWDARAGTEITTLIGHERRVNGFAIAPNGQIVSVSDDGSVKVWDMLAGVELGALVGHANIVRDCSVFPESNQVVSVSEDSTIKIWNPVDVNTSKDLAGHSQRVNGCAFTKDSRFLLSASSDTTIKVWDTESGKPTKTYRGHTTPIRSISVNSDSTQFATSSDDHLVRVWDFKTGKQITELNAHTNVVTAVAFSPANPKLLASASWDKSICIWNDNKFTSRIKFPEWVSSLAFSASGKYLIAGCYDNTASIINIQSGNAKTDLYPHTNWVTAVAFSPDEKHVLTGTYDGILKLWDLNGKELKSIMAHEKRVNSCAFSPNGRAVLSVSDDGLVSIWSVESGSKVAEFVSPSPVLSVAISPSKLIGVGDAIGRVMIHQLMGN